MELNSLAHALVEQIRRAIADSPPDGVDRADVDGFFGRMSTQVLSLVTLALQDLLPASHEKLDEEYRAKWGGHTPHTIERWAASTDQHDWLFSRVLAHRPDLTATVKSLAAQRGLDFDKQMAASRSVFRLVPAVTDGRLVVYEADEALLSELPGVLAHSDFAEFAKAAYWSDDLPALLLEEIAGSWFVKKIDTGSVPPNLEQHGDRLEELVQQTRMEGVLGDEEAERRLAVRLAVLATAGVAPEPRRIQLPKPDPNLALSPSQLAIELDRETPSGEGERQTANLEAIATLLSQPSAGDAALLLRYTGWGGLSLGPVQGLLPPDLAPDAKALVHEYYTPTNVAKELARLLEPRVQSLPRSQSGEILALEPSAGIGRLINAFSVRPWDVLSWTVVEYSTLSSAILRRARPDLTVLNTAFEQWIVSTAGRMDGRLGLVLCNPPFGQRGAEASIDPSPDYRERKAYWYFLRRTLRLLAEGGLGVYIIPYGFMTSTAAPFVRLREQVLKEAHLIAAFRLPSKIYPGAGIVTDAIVLESRGGRIPSVLVEDQYIADGSYFKQHPTHLLGREVGSNAEEEAYRYEVRGDFTSLPSEPDLRPRCKTCTVERTVPEVPKSVQLERTRLAQLPEGVAGAASLGRRVGKYLDLLSTGGLAALAQARAQRGELLQDLLTWASSNSLTTLNEYAKVDGIPALLSAFTIDGTISPSIAEAQAVTLRYTGTGDLGDTARWLVRERGPFSDSQLREFRSGMGFPTPTDIRPDLLRASFAIDWTDPPVWLQESDYYAGLVGEKYQRALAHKDDPIAAAQLSRLRQLIRFPTLQEIAPSPRLAWMPTDLLRLWIGDVLGESVPELERVADLVTLKGIPYSSLKAQIGTKNDKAILIGWINFDTDLFQPPYTKLVDEDGEEESSEAALERARVLYGTVKDQHFRTWLLDDENRVATIEQRYTLNAYVPPRYDESPLEIGRWGTQIVLKPHQCSVVRRLVNNNGGLNAFDTGVGKTFSGIATMAMQRQLGACRRPLIVVPNTLIWKWYRDILRCLPDYRVLVVGSDRKLNRSGVWTSVPDSAEDREVKWRRFQSGQYDCAIVPYSFFGSIGLRTEAWRQFALKTPLLARKLSLEARDLEETVSRALERERTGKDPEPPRISDKRASDFVGEDRWEAASLEEREAFRTEVQKEVMRANYERDKRLIALTDKLASLSERSQALMAESLENYAAEKAAATAANGITFEEIGIDFLLVDEAQNFKNIWAVGQLDGGNPKYLGAIQSGSERGIQLAAYRSNLSQRLGTPGGTYLLSATPAKNSPIEYFTLINLVNERAWADVGVPTVESFIYRYLYIERRDVIQPDMEVKEQSVVAGFQNLVELRDVIFRYAEFKTAKDVGLKLPESKSETILVDMEPDQQAMYYELASFYQSTLHQLGVAQGGPKANRLKNRALSLLTKMQLATIHPLLATGPQTPEHTAFIDLPYDHPDVPTEERERRLLLLTLARRDPIGGQIDSLYRDLLQSADSEVLSRFRIAGEPLYEAAKKKFAKKRKLKTQFTYSSAVNAANYHSPKLDKCVEFIASNPNCGQIVFCDNVAVHRWLVELLVEAGIVRSRIAVINGEVAKDAMKRLDISDKFNGIPAVVAPDGTIEVEEVSPSFDVVIANQAAYEGIDLHRRTCMVYHLDLPWEPSTLRQRNGRAVRQGNLESNVSIRFLMARRSLDVVRYEYILGKLRWMSDLIESTDNSLSNPAADSEIDSESLVLFMSRDEDEAKAAIATLRAQQEAKRRRQIATRAWRDLEAVQQRRRSLRMLDTADSGLTPAEQSERRIVLVEDIRRITAGLVSLSPESWPFAWVVQLERPFVIEHDRVQNSIPIVEDWTLGGKIEFGRLSPGEFGWRRFGDVRWHRKSLAEDDDELAELLLTGYEPEDTRTQPRYPVEDLHGQLALLLEELRTTGTFELLGLKLCSARWRARLHSDHWSDLVATLRQTSLDFQVPIRPPGGGWKLVDSDDPQVTEETLAPFDRATYSSFFSWASTNRTSLTYSATALTTEAWWGIRFPRGRLLPESVTYDNTRLRRRVKALVLDSSDDLAVVHDEGGTTPYYLLHLPSSGTIVRGFATEDRARRALHTVKDLANWSWETAPFELSPTVMSTLDRLANETGGANGEAIINDG